MSKSIINFTLTIALLLVGAIQASGQNVPPAETKEQEGKLIAVLKSDTSHKEKADACRQLAVIGTKDAVAPLAALLGDEKLSHMARYGLEPIPDPAVDVALRTALGQLKGQPLIGIIGSLGVRRDTQAIEPLGKMLQDPDVQVAQAAARALGKIGNLSAARTLQNALSKAPAARQLDLCEGLFRCAEALAAQGRPNDAIVIYDQLSSLPALHQVRTGALRGAILVRGKDGLPLLQKHLRSNDFIMFSAALQTTQELPGAEVTRVLTAELNQLSAANQISVIQMLGRRGDATALPTVIEKARHGNVALRVAALKALGPLGDASVVSTLFEAAVDLDPEVADTAKTTLAGLTNQKEVESAIVAMIEKGRPNARLVALDIVAQQHTSTATPFLLKAASDPDKQIRIAAINALGQTGKTRDLSALVGILVSRKNAEELGAAENSVKIICSNSPDKQACTGILLEAIPKTQGDAKCAILRLLRVSGGSNAIQAVHASTTDANPEIQETAIRTLGDWPTSDAAPVLLEMAQTSPNPSHKITALRGYIRLIRDKNLSTEMKLAMSREAVALVQRDEEKKLLLGVLGEVPAVEALSMAMVHLDNSATKDEASFAVVAISEKIVQQKPDEVSAALKKVMQVTNNKNVIDRAKAILDKITSKN
ncbi:MAG: HEAT repeat domain-containing protein [Sedimentisphaerales bacterium]|nr:HEAT repeat domain-containing protein [Sedimentisphaerales bacterium]